MTKPDYQMLLRIASLVETIKPADFSMSTFQRADIFNCEGNKACGSVGCALGYGSQIMFGQRFEDLDRDALDQGGLPALASLPADPYYYATRHKLQLSDNEWDFLFGSETWKYNCPRLLEKPHQTAARIRRFVYFKMKLAEIHEAWNERQHKRGLEHIAHPMLQTLSGELHEEYADYELAAV